MAQIEPDFSARDTDSATPYTGSEMAGHLSVIAEAVASQQLNVALWYSLAQRLDGVEAAVVRLAEALEKRNKIDELSNEPRNVIVMPPPYGSM